ncbi:MAG: FtsW/RodA/SpoVE family cell cycle protein [Bacteroidota bacterium]
MTTVTTKISSQFRGDRSIWLVVVLLSLFSLLAVFSTTAALAYRERGGDTSFFVMKHMLLLVGGFALMYICYLIHYMRYSKFSPMLLVITVVLLIYTFFFGTTLNDATRWITIPFVGISFQTSDLAKLSLIVYVARAISMKQDYIKDLKSAFLPIIIPIILVCGLIAPSDLSTAMLLFFTCVFLMFIGRVALKYIGLLLLLGVVVFAMMIILSEIFPGVFRVDTWIARTHDFRTNPEGSYQVQQAKMAIAEGGIFGVGPGNSVHKNFLPSGYADFIYALIIEEYGLFGGLSVLLLYVLLFFRVVSLVTRSPKAFGAMLALGLCLILVFQALANMAVAVHLVPVTGLPLPMVSMGGTSLLFTCVSIGMILSVSKYIEKAA